jgi:hypothetical protein
MKTIAALIAILIGAGLSYGQTTFPYREKTDVDDASRKAEVTIEIAEKVLRQNETYTIKYTFHALNSYEVYNWQFNQLLPLPGQLVIYDENMRYMGDLIAFSGGSRRMVSDTDWTFLWGGSFVGTTLSFRAGNVPNNPGTGLLSPGTYYIQLVLYRAFLSPRLDPPTFHDKFDTSELFRSNAIRVTIVSR